MGFCKCAYCVDSDVVVLAVMNVALNVTFTEHNWPLSEDTKMKNNNREKKNTKCDKCHC